MMTKLYYYLLGLLLIISVQSCKEKEINDPTNPQINLEEEVEAFRGETMQIQAVVTHEMGVKAVRLYQPDWSLDRTINLEEEGSPKEFNLDYMFAVPTDAADEVTIEITATSVGDNTTTASQKVMTKASESMYLMAHNLEGRDANWGDPSTAIKMEKSSDNPNEYSTVVTFMSGGGSDAWGSVLAIIGQTTGVLPFNAVVDFENVPEKYKDSEWWGSDNNYVQESNYPGYVKFDDEAGTMEFDMVTQEDASTPIVEEPGFYNLHPLAFYDNGGKYEVKFNKETMKLTISLTEAVEPPVEADMYIVGGGFPESGQWWDPSNGIPMTTTEEGVYTKTNIEIEAGAEMKFVGQRDWSPDNFGWIAQNEEENNTTDETRAMHNDQGSIPYLFEEAGYYDIVFNKNNLTVTITKVGDVAPPEFPIAEELYIIAGGTQELEDGSWYDPSQALQMNKVADGIFDVTLNFNDLSEDDWGVYFSFVGQTDAYTPINFGLTGGNDDPTDNEVFDLTKPIEDLNYENIDSKQSFVYYYNKPGEYKITVNINDQTVSVVSTTVETYYLMGHNLDGSSANWGDPSTAILMTQSESNANLFSTTVTFMADGGNDAWGSVLAVIGQNTAVTPFNAVLDIASVDQSHYDTDSWWNGNTYEQGNNYPGYVVYDNSSDEMIFDLVTDAAATTPIVQEPEFYNLQPLAFYNSPGTYVVTFDKASMTLTLELQ
ncbi:cadherin repeat domain-containing protein [Flammeovirga agarivorans]|uniref:SusF/SusE family outer membrane protein n=1 Tax=Flammeovirga agarivorans TaxID=2726742 RepID=A0A7X8SHR4_9BACT|nr:SusF/SusE family outer membrane protein [Flammeovirga agarivorans]NLR90367.1 SusF/SusE family outer membrane protein [Flammeovirga agarivorans]